MAEDKYFQYQDNIEVFAINTFCVEIGHIYSETELYDVYDTNFKFPYFGFNWDALRDSLCGLDEWIKEKKIIIVHKELPYLGEVDIRIYISVLYDVCELWERYPDVLEFRVFFPQRCRDKIQEILKTISSRFP